MLNCFKRPAGLFAAAVLILLAGTVHADPQDENIECTLTTENTRIYEGIYQTDGTAGLTVISFVNYAILPSGKTHVCKIGLRFPDPKRVTHCTITGACLPGAQVNVDFIDPGNVKGFTFKSTGFQLVPAGHAGGNYRDYRYFWDACAAAGTCPGGNDAVVASYSSLHPHVDIHFFHEDSAYIDSQLGFLGAPPAETLAKCASLPAKPYLPSGHYAQGDCTRLQGHHWAEDKFETADTFLNQPPLKYVTFDGKPLGVMLGATNTVIDWVDANALNDEATISFPQPEAIKRQTTFPANYFMRIVPSSQEIGGGKTVEIGLSDFAGLDDKDNDPD